MIRYKTFAASGFLELGTVIRMSPKQAKLRGHLLDQTDTEGVYRLKGRASFLRGEEFDLEAELPRNYEGIFERVATAAEKEAAEAEAKAAAEKEAAEAEAKAAAEKEAAEAEAKAAPKKRSARGK